ncbi:hypothetical protein BRADI_4g38115v3 [Brachypodium distachyon]|uniref:Uncharacterized protein n=1 Tax=Brachypodium distachyon TaxID=15368 RepID=A0A2K2CT17_BRADI|nr:hypothetical protein BRADI_4g38115v3 [Brachypodium distachyon]
MLAQKVDTILILIRNRERPGAVLADKESTPLQIINLSPTSIADAIMQVGGAGAPRPADRAEADAVGLGRHARQHQAQQLRRQVRPWRRDLLCHGLALACTGTGKTLVPWRRREGRPRLSQMPALQSPHPQGRHLYLYLCPPLSFGPPSLQKWAGSQLKGFFSIRNGAYGPGVFNCISSISFTAYAHSMQNS